MERWCGSLGQATISRSAPYVLLALRQLQLAQLNAITARYDLYNNLRPFQRDETLPLGQEQVFSNCTIRQHLFGSSRRF